MHGNGNAHDALLDALIAGALAGLGTLTGVYATTGSLPGLSLVYGAFLAFLGTFLISLQVARGRKEDGGSGSDSSGPSG